MNPRQGPLLRSVTIVALTTGLLVASVAGFAHAQCDVPLVSQQVTVPPNVMIVMDSSGSMQTILAHEDYDSSVNWSGPFSSGGTYTVSMVGDYAPSDFDGTWATSPTVRLVPGLHGYASQYPGRYLNWLYFHATDAQRAAAPQVTRQMVQNTAVKYVMSAAGNLRFGLTKFNGGNGGLIVEECGASTADLEQAVDSMVASGVTPLAETLWTVQDYFRGNIGSSPIGYECQQNFVIMITDGLPVSDNDLPSVISDSDNDGYLDNVAEYVANTDLRSDLEGEQNLVVFTIGFGINNQLLIDAAENGKGLFREAWDLQTLVVELGTVIGDIINRISAGAAVAVVSTETGDDSYLYRGKFVPGLWRGYLEAFELPFHAGESPVWEAGALLRDRDPDSRVVFTSVNNTIEEFSVSNVDAIAPLIAPDGPGSGEDRYDGWGDDDDDNLIDAGDLNLGPDYDGDYVAKVIEYVRGHAVPGFRDREGWILGDLVHSTPIVVGPPAQFHLTQSYQDFILAHRSRRPMVYAGANDGMLHAFDAGTGKELWAYVPQDVLGTLEDLADPAYCHRSYVDLSPTAVDVEIGGSWRTVLIGGLRTGGDAYFALDVTDPYGPEVLWETRIPSLVNSFTDPVVVRTTRGSFVWTGSGPNPSGNAYAGVIDIETGAIHWNLLLSSGASGRNAATAPTPIDTDFDGYHDRVYQGDLAGNLWVFDVSDPSAWYYDRLFDGALPIQARPALAMDEEGRVNVYFGTGAFIDSSDQTDTTPQRFYCVRDDGAWTTHTDGDLAAVGNSFVDTSTMAGWSFPLENGSGERVIEPATTVEGVVYFSSFAPDDAPCSAGGHSFLYAVDYRGGTPIDRDEDEDLSDESRSTSVGEGIASRPVVNLADEEIIIQTSDARLNVEDMVLTPQRILVRAWRERFDAATAQADPPNTP